MNILISDLLNKYEQCRSLVNYDGKIFILKNGKPDAVLLSITEYQKLSGPIEECDHFDKEKFVDFLLLLPDIGKRVTYTLAQLKHDLNFDK